jgi:hypothetical protein
LPGGRKRAASTEPAMLRRTWSFYISEKFSGHHRAGFVSGHDFSRAVKAQQKIGL